MNNSAKIPYCPECKKKFSRITHLRLHARKFHPDKVDTIAPKIPAKFRCNVCDKPFVSEKYYKLHKKTHEVPSDRHNLSCPMCEYSSKRCQPLIEHFQTIHNINLINTLHEFPTFSDFETWKKKMEHDRKEQYVKARANFTNCEGNKVVQYSCHRSGHFVSKSKGLRQIKTQGSIKINAFCPAFLKVVVLPDGKCEVVFTETHVGHENDLRHLVLSSEERAAIAAKISRKIPLDEILNEVRDSASGSELSRIHLLSKKDLYNIVRDYDLKSSVQFNSDAVGVEGWLKQMEESGFVLFYKPQGTKSIIHEELQDEDFVLIVMTTVQEEFLKKYGSNCICVDTIRDLNMVLVVDDHGEGFPCGFLVSNRCDEDIWMIFCNYIKGRVGEIRTNTFISKMDSSSYNAWEMVMGAPAYRIYSTWHVDHAIRENLSKIDYPEKQVAVYKYFRSLLHETDQNTFSIMLKEFLQYSETDPDIVNFGRYFQHTFGNVIDRWAYSYRPESGITTNVPLERIYRSIEHIYLHGQKASRFDKGISAIMQFLRNKLSDRLRAKPRRKLCTKMKLLRQRHQLSEQLGLDMVSEERDSWQVVSSATSDIYHIQENAKICTCGLVCEICSVCVHRYVCTCVDSAVRLNMCKHVHLLCRYLKQKEVRSEENNADQADVELSLTDESTPPDESEVFENIVPSFQEELEQFKNTFIENLNNIKTRDELEAVKKIVASIEPTLAAMKTVANPSENKTIIIIKKIQLNKK